MAAKAKLSHSRPFAARTRARDEKTHAVLRTAAVLFLELGYHRTTLSDVAARLNITKTALYNYFKSKEEILEACYRLGRKLVVEAISPIDQDGGDGLAKLRELIRRYAMIAISEFGKCLVRLDDRELSKTARARVRAQKRSDDLAFRKYIVEGIADGSIVACDAKLAAFAIAGSLNWIAYWYQPKGSLSAEKIADEYAILLTNGLAVERIQPAIAADRSSGKKTGRRQGATAPRASARRTSKSTQPAM